MPLAEGRGAVSPLTQHFDHRCRVRIKHALVAGIGVRHVHHGAHIGPVGIPSGQERCASRRTDGGSVKAVVAQPLSRECFHTGCFCGAAEGAGGAEAHIVEQHHDHVGSAVRRLDLSQSLCVFRLGQQ